MFFVLPGDISSKVYVCVCLQEYCNMMKRRSRDIETETEEELLLLVFPAHPHGPDHSSGSLSLSSSVSLSDKSVSTDNNLVEEYVSDVPFAGESTHTLSLHEFSVPSIACLCIFYGSVVLSLLWDAKVRESRAGLSGYQQLQEELKDK